MRPELADVLVIGGGMAGSIAATVAARRGLSVTLLRKGYGATALSSGVIDLPAMTGLPIIAWQEAIRFFLQAAAATGYLYLGEADAHVRLLTANGAVKRTHLYPATTAAGALDAWAEERILFVGIRGLAECNAAFVARAARQYAAELGLTCQIDAAEIDFPGVRHRYNITGFELAQLLDNAEQAARFADAVAAAAGSATRVALPPVMGVERSAQALAAVQSACRCPCFELVSGLPSLLGLRLQHTLRRMLPPQVWVLHGEAVGITARDGRIQHVRAVDQEREHDLIPRYVVLATGKFIGGGIGHDRRLRERVLDLPLWLEGRPLVDQPLRDLSRAAFAEMQPFMRVGLRVDAAWRPLRHDGHAAYKNLHAAGAILQDEGRDECWGALGAALIEGYTVGKIIGS